jgi:GTP cyclohydrolase IV
MDPTPLPRVPDVQASAPAIHVSLSRVGVTNVEKVTRIGPRGAEQLYYAKLDCFVDLGPDQKGAHMSRFEEVINDVIGEVMLGEGGFKAEQLAQRIAVEVRERQDALRAEVTIAARYPEHKPAPVSGIPTQEIYTLLGSAVASERGTRRLVGVAAQGMTACPCAQQLVAGRSRERLAADGFTDDEIADIFEAVPVATHNQRGLGTLHLGLPEE